jgi:hypothetical protein
MTLQRILLALATLASFACRENPATSGDDARCGISFASARSDPALREAYFASLAQCDPSVREARDSGKVLKVLYAPDSARIRKELSQAYGALGYSQADISRLSEATIAGSLETASTALAAISSTDFGFFARGVPVFILAYEKIFTWPQPINRYDMESILVHEVQHARDWHDGVSVPPYAIGNREVAEGTVGADWTVQLLELRAVYRELDAAFEPKARVDSFHISGSWFASRAEAYAGHWRSLDSLAVTESEIAVGAAQKREFRGIVPEARGDTLLLRFDRYGRILTAVFEAAPAPKHSAAVGLLPKHALARWEKGNG